jgi:hypothetical protein
MNYIKLFLTSMTLATIASCGGGGGCASSEACKADAASNTTTFVATPASAVSVAIGQGDTIEVTAQEIKYKKRFAVTVSDANGRPVVGAKVAANVVMVGFYKGRLFRNSTFELTGYGVAAGSTGDASNIQAGEAVFCASEDKNSNDVLDLGEDLNNDKSLTPARAEAVAVIDGTDITDAQGIVYVVVEYYKSSATWVSYDLVTSTSVTGTEGKTTKRLRSSFVAGDEAKATTPFVRSPFGITAGCDNSN